MDVVAAFRMQAAACADLGSPMYAEILDRATDDLAAGGVTAAVLAGHEGDPVDSALALRLMGSVHRLVLERRAGGLATFYPSVGGTWEAESGWRAFHTLLSEQGSVVREWLDRPPQTNEVGRASALYGGLLHLSGGLPVRLFEIGASAGLNLNADRFAYTDEEGRRRGAADAVLVLDGAWAGRSLPVGPPRIVERLGCDVAPVDVGTTEGRLTLTAYVWADQTARLERLRAAIETARTHPVEVRREGAASFVRGIEPVEGMTTVLWHSVMWQYLPPEERAAVTAEVARIGRSASRAAPFAHLRAEPVRRTQGERVDFVVTLTAWPGGAERVIGHTVGHGVPTTWT